MNHGAGRCDVFRGSNAKWEAFEIVLIKNKQ